MLIKSRLSATMWASAILFVLLLFALPIYTMTQLQRIPIEDFILPDERNMLYFSRIFSSGNIGVKFFTFAFGVFIPWNLFSYMHSTSKVDLYHSLPISRRKLFFSNFIAGNLAYIMPYLATSILAAILYAVGTGYFNFQIFIYTIGLNLFFYNLFFLSSTFATIVTGSRITTVLMTLVIYETIQFIQLGAQEIAARFWVTYIRPDEQITLMLSPITLFFADILKHRMVISVVLLVIFFLLDLVLFEKRPSETAGKAVWGNIFAQVVKYIVLIAVAIVGGLIFESINRSYNELGWMYFGFIFTAVVGHMIIEGIYNFDIKQIFRNWPGMIAFVAVFCISVLMISRDSLGYDTKYTPVAEIANYEINLVDMLEENYKYSFRNKVLKISSDESKIFADEFLKKVIEETKVYRQITREYEYDSSNDIPYDWKVRSDIEVNKKDGSSYKRSYPRILKKDFLDFLYQVYDSPDFKSSDIVIPSLENKELEKAIIYFGPNYTNTSEILSSEFMNQLYQAALKDFQNSTAEQLKNTPPIGEIEFWTKDVNPEIGLDDAYEPSYMETNFAVPIYEFSTETIALLKAKNLYAYKPIDIDDILSIELYDYENENEGKFAATYETKDEDIYKTTITDRSQYKQLLETFSSEEMARLNPLLYIDSDVYINVHLKDGVVLTMRKIQDFKQA